MLNSRFAGFTWTFLFDRFKDAPHLCRTLAAAALPRHRASAQKVDTCDQSLPGRYLASWMVIGKARTIRWRSPQRHSFPMVDALPA
jgi:hypothetical protein